MAHNIFGSRFYGHRTPAWHGLGVVNSDELAAAETLNLLGNYQMILDPLLRSIDSQPSGKHAILRLPTADDNHIRQFGVVDPGYELVQPGDVAAMWDKHVGINVETMAALKLGKVLFVTGKLPSFEVKGDAVNNYLAVASTMDGKTAFWGGVTSTRVVCQNTLTVAKHNARQTFRVPHYTGALEQMGLWLGNVYQGALATLSVMKEAYEVLASNKATEGGIKWIAESIYPDPQRPDINKLTKSNYETRLAWYEYQMEWTGRARSTILDLYGGSSGKGVTGALAGTLWAGWNAVTEFETYRRGTLESTALNLLIGDRAGNINKAFELCMELVPARR